MSRIFEARPVVIKITVLDDESGEMQERHIVGYTMEEVLEGITNGFNDGPSEPVPAKKPRKARGPNKPKLNIITPAPTTTDSAPPHDKKAWA